MSKSKHAQHHKPSSAKKWLKLGAVAVALLLIPRRSSEQAEKNASKPADSASSENNPKSC